MEKIPTDIPNESEETKEEKPRVFDIDKGWREQLTPQEVEKIKNWAKRIVKQWHDEVRPDYIFLTETSAIPFGYILKETWKTMYGKDVTPDFFRIDPEYLKGMEVLSRKKELERNWPNIKNHIRDLIKKDNPKIIVFDEGNIMDTDVNQEYYNNFIFSYDEKDGIDKKGMHIRSLRLTMEAIKRVFEQKKPLIWGSQQALKEILEKIEETKADYEKRTILPELRDEIERVCEYKGINVDDFWNNRIPPSKIEEIVESALSSLSGWDAKKAEEIKNKWREELHKGKKSRKPTSKASQSRNWNVTPTEDMVFQDLGSDQKVWWPSFKGKIVKHPEQRKRAIDYVNDLQELGREAGEELKRESEV